MNPLDLQRSPTLQRGFSLIELSVVIVVVALLLGALMIPLNTQLDQQKINESKARIAAAKEALYAFAIANGRFPCPDDPATTDVTKMGKELFAAGKSAVDGGCNVFVGYLPGVTLGLSNLDATGHYMDGWWSGPHARMRYAVADWSTTVNSITLDHVFTAQGGMKNAFVNIGGMTNGLWVCAGSTGITASDCGTGVALNAGNAVAVVFSFGKNSQEVLSGAVTPYADEQINFAASTVFVMHDPVSAAGSIFDDQVEWVSVFALISHLVNAGVAP